MMTRWVVVLLVIYLSTTAYAQNCTDCTATQGECISDGMCRCFEGFTGSYCNISCTATACGKNETCISTAADQCTVCEDCNGIDQLCITANDTALCHDCDCQNGAECMIIPESNEIGCDCMEGFVGGQCQNTCPECVNGTCTDNDTTAVCDCIEGYMGDICDKQKCNDDSALCANGGTCQTDMTCMCAEGYEGDLCQDKASGTTLMVCEVVLLFSALLAFSFN